MVDQPNNSAPAKSSKALSTELTTDSTSDRNRDPIEPDKPADYYTALPHDPEIVYRKHPFLISLSIVAMIAIVGVVVYTYLTTPTN